jgi:hypothetical protein
MVLFSLRAGKPVVNFLGKGIFEALRAAIPERFALQRLLFRLLIPLAENFSVFEVSVQPNQNQMFHGRFERWSHRQTISKVFDEVVNLINVDCGQVSLAISHGGCP